MIGIARKLLLVLPILAIVAVCFRPTPVTGVDGESLAASVGVPVGESGFEPCSEEGRDTWTCTLPGPEDSTAEAATQSITYSLDIDWLGCWTATQPGAASNEPALEGCVTIADHIESID